MKKSDLFMVGLAAAVFFGALVYSRRQQSPYIRVTQYGSEYGAQPAQSRIVMV